MRSKIIKYGSNVLRTKCHDVLNAELAAMLTKELWEELAKTNGIGLAGPQIGMIWNIFVLNVPEKPLMKMPMNEGFEDLTKAACRKVFINPKIESYGEDMVTFKEGCLSIPGIMGNVKRSYMIAVSYLDENMQPQIETLFDLNAIAFQHEYDHLNGILFIDRMETLERKLLEKKLKRLANG